jgi:uncharacterized membrane protein YadS
MSAEVGASAPEDFDQRNLARVKKLRRVSLLLPLTVGSIELECLEQNKARPESLRSS